MKRHNKPTNKAHGSFNAKSDEDRAPVPRCARCGRDDLHAGFKACYGFIRMQALAAARSV